MLKTADIECKLDQIEPGLFQKVCNEILCKMGYIPYDYAGSQKGTYKTKPGTPDSVFLDSQKRYVYVEYTTIKKESLNNKIIKDVEKCLTKIKDNTVLNNKVSKILFIHNTKNPDETITEKIKLMCNDIEFEIYGIDFLANKLQNECKETAISLLGLKVDNTQRVLMLDNNQIIKLAEEIAKKSNIKDYEENSLNEIKKKIKALYTDAGIIINNEDSIIYLSNSNKEKLKIIYNSLHAFDFYYKNNESNESIMYYHNLLVILSKIDVNEAIDKYESLNNFAKNNPNTIHFYTTLLIENGSLEEAEKILNKLYYNDNYKTVFETLIKTHFLQKKYDKVVNALSKLKTSEFDRYGFLSSMFVISKNHQKKYTEKEILKLNSKFNKMPLFYGSTAEILYNLDKRKKKYKEQFKKGISLLNSNDIIAIDNMCIKSVELKLENEMIKYLLSIDLSPALKIRLIHLLTSKEKLSEEETKKIIEIKDEVDKNEIDYAYVEGIVLENKGKELEAISKYKDSYLTNKNISSIHKYITLSIKNKSKIEQNIIEKLSLENTLNSAMLIVEAYKYTGNYEKAIKHSYKALYLTKGNFSLTDVFKQFWGTLILSGNKEIKENKEVDHICKDTVVTLLLSDSKKQRIIVLEDEDFYLESTKILNVEIARTYGEIGSELINCKINDVIEINNNKYIIKEIKDKYTYFGQYCFKYLETDKDIEIFTSNTDNSKEALAQIQEKIMQIDESINHRLDVYEESKVLPLSALLDKEKSVCEYAKLINTLLLDEERVFLAGEPTEINLTSGFVIDLSSIIVLALFELLNIFTNEICEKIYITTSLKNKFQYFYEDLLRKQGQTERTIGVSKTNNDKKIALSEIPVNEMIKFWKEVRKSINKFQVIDIEMEKDEMFNDSTSDIFDKTQFDLIELAKIKNLPFICDDLAFRKVCNAYNIKHSNSLQFVETVLNNSDEYLSTLKKYAKSNYIYSLHGEKLTNIFKYLYDNYSEDAKNEFIEIINSLSENEASFNYYGHIFANIVSNLKKSQYINIFENTYENLAITFIINTLENIIIKSCDNYNIDLNQFKLI